MFDNGYCKEGKTLFHSQISLETHNFWMEFPTNLEEYVRQCKYGEIFLHQAQRFHADSEVHPGLSLMILNGIWTLKMTLSLSLSCAAGLSPRLHLRLHICVYLLSWPLLIEFTSCKQPHIWLLWLRDIRSLDENFKLDLPGDSENVMKLALGLGIKAACWFH